MPQQLNKCVNNNKILIKILFIWRVSGWPTRQFICIIHWFQNINDRTKTATYKYRAATAVAWILLSRFDVSIPLGFIASHYFHNLSYIGFYFSFSKTKLMSLSISIFSFTAHFDNCANYFLCSDQKLDSPISIEKGTFSRIQKERQNKFIAHRKHHYVWFLCFCRSAVVVCRCFCCCLCCCCFAWREQYFFALTTT